MAAASAGLEAVAVATLTWRQPPVVELMTEVVAVAAAELLASPW